MMPFRSRLTLDQRCAELARAMRIRPDLIPVILVKGNRDTPFLDREKLLISSEYTGQWVSQFVRKRLDMLPGQALFLLCNDKLISQQTTIGELASKYRDKEDGFLYIHYCLEHAFGFSAVPRIAYPSASQGGVSAGCARGPSKFLSWSRTSRG